MERGYAIAEEGFEAVVHVGLDVAVEEGEAGLVGGKLDGRAAVKWDDDDVLDDAGGGLAVEVDSSHWWRCICRGWASSVRLWKVRR